MKTTKRIVPSIIIIGLFVIMASSCSSNNEEYSQELKDQVSALQTQNALLQEDLTSEDEQVEVPSPPSSNSSTQLMTSVPLVETLPTDSVQAGIPVIFDGWALTLSDEIETGSVGDDEVFIVIFTIRNIGDKSRVFRYIKSGVTVVDNLGNNYDFLLSQNQCREEPDNIHLTQQLTIEAGESINIEGYADWGWGCLYNDYFPPFKGILPLNADQLIISVNNWGPYKDVNFVLDL